MFHFFPRDPNYGCRYTSIMFFLVQKTISLSIKYIITFDLFHWIKFNFLVVVNSSFFFRNIKLLINLNVIHALTSGLITICQGLLEISFLWVRRIYDALHSYFKGIKLIWPDLAIEPLFSLVEGPRSEGKQTGVETDFGHVSTWIHLFKVGVIYTFCLPIIAWSSTWYSTNYR